jgi:hypothetical protein
MANSHGGTHDGRGGYIVISMNVVLDRQGERKTVQMPWEPRLLCFGQSALNPLISLDEVLFCFSSLEGLIGVKRSTPTPS